jgi:hypothetical protein
MQRCTELEAELAELRAQYEMYFMGNERIPPLKQHDLFKRALQRLKGAQVRQTAVKFRIDSITQKLTTFERLWERTMKEIEAGTYKRDIARLKRHTKGGEKKKAAGDDFQIDEDLDLSDLDSDGGADDLASALAAAEAAAEARAKAAPAIAPAVKPVTGSVPAIAPSVKPVTGVAPAIKPATGVVPAITPITPLAPVAPPRPSGPPKITAPMASGSTPALKPAAPPVAAAKPAATGSNPAFKPASSPPMRPPAAGGGDGGLSDTKVKAIYDAYVMAKKRCGEDTRAVTLDSVASSLRKQVPELMKQHNAKSVEFKVVIKDGKAVLRALPKD